MKLQPVLGIASIITGIYAKNSTHVKHYGGSSVGWTSCGNVTDHPLECATVHVPMDHFDAKRSGNKTFSIPMVRLIAKNATETILFNPGGPGGSGVEFIAEGGAEYFNTLIGEGFHLLGFDPRGVGQSRPAARCYRPEAPKPVIGKQAGGPLGITIDTYSNMETNSADYYAQALNTANACHEVTGEYGSFINTPQTAADMNDILKSIGQTKMHYWGFSYGSVLGTTYAQMFPEQSHRIMIDGVVNPHVHYGEIGDTSLVDTDNCWQGLLEECFKAGETCELSRNFVTAEEMTQNITGAIDALIRDPAAVYINATAYGIVRSEDIRHDGIFLRLYSPSRWPLLARSLAALLRGDFITPFLHFYGDVAPPKTFKGLAVAAGDEEGADEDSAYDFITLSDSLPVDQLTRIKPTRAQYVDSYRPTESYIAAGLNGTIPFYDVAWKYARTHNFTPANEVRTAHPLLILSTTFDPVTPLQQAKIVEKEFVDSVLLEQTSIGHSSASMPSRCKVEHVRNFLYHGILPQRDTKCGIDRSYFPNLLQSSAFKSSGKSLADIKLDEALEKLAEHKFVSRPLGPRSRMIRS